MQRRPVNERQLDVLRWVGAGCPDRAWPDESYKTSARALANRGLVSITRRAGQWSASITSAGQHYLDHRDYPQDSSARSVSPAPGKRTRRTAARRPGRRTGKPVADESSVATNPNLTAAEEVITTVLAAGGRADLGKVDFDVQRILAAADRATDRPHDRILRLDAYGDWFRPKYVAYLEDLAQRVERGQVPIPGRVPKPHPAVAAYKADADRQMVTTGSLAGAIRLLQALATEATRRGHVVAPKKYGDLYHAEFRRSLGNGQLEITVDGFTYGILIVEKHGKGGRRQDYSQFSQRKLPRWRQVRQYTFVPIGRLSITIVTLGSNRDGRPLTFADSTRTRLEDQLPEVLWELEVRALEDARARRRAEAAEAGKTRRWEAAMDLAKQRLIQSHRREVLTRQAQAWSQANHLRSYVDAMEAKVAAMSEGEQRAHAQRWWQWCRDNIGLLDPLEQDLAIPTPPEPTAQNLEPFLDGWSYYGPKRSSR